MWQVTGRSRNPRFYVSANTGYREALVTWREGKVEPVFPAGTYLMRVAHGVACAAAG
jgi:hypothetical protein